MSSKRLPDEVLKRLDLHLTEKTVGDSAIYDHVFYEVGKESGVYVTNHGAVVGREPYGLESSDCWAVISTLGEKKFWGIVSTEMLLTVEKSVFEYIVENFGK